MMKEPDPKPRDRRLAGGPRRNIQAVVFDKDGVLADSEAINLRSAFEVFRQHGYELVEDDEPSIVGRHPIDYVPELARRFGMSEDEQRRVIAEQDVMYTRFWRRHGRLLDGAREALDTARRMRFKTGVATSSGRAELDEFIERFDLGAYFDVTLSLDDVTASKPDPEMYLSAAQRLRVPAAAMLVVEDSEHGVRAAKDAGALCVAVRTSHVPCDRIAIADLKIDSVGDLPALLDRLQRGQV